MLSLLLAGSVFSASAMKEESWRLPYEQEFKDKWVGKKEYSIRTWQTLPEETLLNDYLDMFLELNNKNVASVPVVAHVAMFVEAQDVDRMYRELRLVLPEHFYFFDTLQMAMRVRQLSREAERADLYGRLATACAEIEKAGYLTEISQYTIAVTDESMKTAFIVPSFQNICKVNDLPCIGTMRDEVRQTIQKVTHADGTVTYTNALALVTALYNMEWMYYANDNENTKFHMVHAHNVGNGPHNAAVYDDLWREDPYHLAGEHDFDAPISDDEEVDAKRAPKPREGRRMKLGAAGEGIESVVDIMKYAKMISTRGKLLHYLYKYMRHSARPHGDLTPLINKLKEFTLSKEVTQPGNLRVEMRPLLRASALDVLPWAEKKASTKSPSNSRPNSPKTSRSNSPVQGGQSTTPKGRKGRKGSRSRSPINEGGKSGQNPPTRHSNSPPKNGGQSRTSHKGGSVTTPMDTGASKPLKRTGSNSSTRRSPSPMEVDAPKPLKRTGSNSSSGKSRSRSTSPKP